LNGLSLKTVSVRLYNESQDEKGGV